MTHSPRSAAPAEEWPPYRFGAIDQSGRGAAEDALRRGAAERGGAV
jgi:hypothetical protein